MGTKKFNLGIALMTLTLATYQAPKANVVSNLADRYGIDEPTIGNLADELEAARAIAEQDMKEMLAD